MTIEKVTSAEQWNNLPGPELPELQSAEESGAAYEVTQLGYYPAAREECMALGIKADQPQGVAYALPIAHMKLGQEIVLCKLPIELTSWVLRAILITQRGANPLPATIEFGKLDGRVFADIRQ